MVRFVLAAAAFAVAGSGAAQAQTPEQFYKGKSITVIVSSAPGGGYDRIARLV